MCNGTFQARFNGLSQSQNDTQIDIDNVQQQNIMFINRYSDHTTIRGPDAHGSQRMRIPNKTREIEILLIWVTSLLSELYLNPSIIKGNNCGGF